MRRNLILIFALVVFVALNYSIYAKEKIINSGKTVYLKLAPRDPRSLMQGDYMRLNYEITTKLNEKLRKEAQEARKKYAKTKDKKYLNTRPFDRYRASGYIVVTIDKEGQAQYKRIYQKSEKLAENEKLLKYRNSGWRLSIVPDSFFFQEGKAGKYQSAEYGIFKFAGINDYVLIGLADKNKNIIITK